MSDYDFLEQYNTKQLSDMLPEIEKLIKKKEKAEKNALRQQMATLAAENGFTIDEIFKGKGKTTVKRAIKAKYKNPENDQTWSGRGRKPKWVVAFIENGGEIESCEI
jgi:DNA-binding protein H-NS